MTLQFKIISYNKEVGLTILVENKTSAVGMNGKNIF